MSSTGGMISLFQIAKQIGDAKGLRKYSWNIEAVLLDFPEFFNSGLLPGGERVESIRIRIKPRWTAVMPLYVKKSRDS
jgi:hypothetical protein